MLQSISINNYAIIESIELKLLDGMTVITGETGAGKSILLGALGLVLGNRSDSKVLFDQSKNCIVEAVFSIEENSIQSSIIKSRLKEQDIEYTNPLIIRRMINTKGKSRAFINDYPTQLQVLKEITQHLIDLHKQFDTLGLQQSDFQLNIIDALSNTNIELSAYRKEFQNYKHLKKSYDKLLKTEQLSARELDFMKFQLNELEGMQIMPQEYEDLESELEILEKGEEVAIFAQKSDFLIQESDNSIIELISTLLKEIDNFNENEKLSELKERFNSVKEELTDINDEISRISEDLNLDPLTLQEKKSRYDAISKLLHKHQTNSTEAIMLIKAELEKKIASIDSREDSLSKLSKATKDALDKLIILGNKLSVKRKSKLKQFENKVEYILSNMSMSDSKFKVELSQNQEPNYNGTDQIEFQFASNLGSSFLPIKKIASGGELSRLNLAVKSIIADTVHLPTMIFDEIDSGISGEIAAKMAVILKQIAAKHQIITITHQPHIASKGEHHLYIYKTTDKNRTYTNMKVLDQTERIEELAKMLGGDPPTVNAKNNAKELLNV